MTTRDLANLSLSDKTFTPGTTNITFPPGVYDSWRTILGDINLLAANIKVGLKVFNVTGTFTSDATATASEILTGQTAYVNGAKLSGAMVNQGAVALNASGSGTVTIPQGYHNGSGYVAQVSVNAAHVLAGDTIAGVSGTMPNNSGTTYQPGQNVHAGYDDGTSTVSLPSTGSQTFDTPGGFTWTVPVGVQQVLVEIWGAGGGGGGGQGNGSGQNDEPGGGGGSSGDYVMAWMSVTPGSELSGSIGTGGSGGTGGAAAFSGNGGAGSAGGATTFNGITVPGGVGGNPGQNSQSTAPSASPSAPPSGYMCSITGNPGAGCQSWYGSGYVWAAGAGGAPALPTNSSSTGGGNGGAGGDGAQHVVVSAGYPGSSGQNGQVTIRW